MCGIIYEGMRMKLYLDMDGTLVDFVSQVNKYGFWRSDKENKVDWKKVKAMGPRFWSEMDWMPEAEIWFQNFLEWNKDGLLELYILTSIDFEEGRKGKQQWIKNHVELPLKNIIFVSEPEDKAKYASFDSWLIDDRKKSLEPFQAAGGNVIEFIGDWYKVYKKVGGIISDYILTKKSKAFVNKKIEDSDILFEIISSPAFKSDIDEQALKRGFCIDKSGVYYRKREIFEIQGLSECEKSILQETSKLKTAFAYDAIFRAKELATEIKTIMSKYSDKISSFPDKLDNPHILDGSFVKLRFRSKSVSGLNLIEYDRLYRKTPRPKYLNGSITDEEYEQNENNLECLNKIYQEIMSLVNQYQKTEDRKVKKI